MRARPPAFASSWLTRSTCEPSLHEIGEIERFPSVKDFLSYCRLVKGTVASAGKIKGLRGAKLGNPYLRWAFGEAVVTPKAFGAITWSDRWPSGSKRG